MAYLTRYSCQCPNCDRPKYYVNRVTARNREALCKPCRREAQTTGRTKHTRVCVSCGNKKQVGYKPKGDEECRKCSSTARGATLIHHRYKNAKYIRYWVFCPTCPSVRLLKQKQKTNWCGDCSRKHSKTKNVPKYEWSYEMLRHFKICPECPPMKQAKQVSSATKAGIVLCKKHDGTAKVKKPKPIGTRNRIVTKAKQASPAGIARVQQLNREHRAELAEKAKYQEIVPQKKTDEQMMAEFLAKNKVTKIADNKLSGIMHELEFGQ